MKPSSGREKPSPFNKSTAESGDRSKSGMSLRAKGSPPKRDSVVKKIYIYISISGPEV